MNYAQHPANLALRFGLELVTLFALGRLGWRATSGPWRYALGALLPVIAAIAWGTFAVPGDPSRSGNAPVPVPGWLRLALEGVFFACGTLALGRGVGRGPAWVFGIAVVLHYALSLDRARWLLGR